MDSDVVREQNESGGTFGNNGWTTQEEAKRLVVGFGKARSSQAQEQGHVRQDTLTTPQEDRRRQLGDCV